MIELQIKDEQLELMNYSAEATLSELVEALDALRQSEAAHALKIGQCCGCGECCHEPIPVLSLDLAPLAEGLGVDLSELPRFLALPTPPDPVRRRKEIADLQAQLKLPPREATLLYEYNQAEPLYTARQGDGSCIFLRDERCTIYPFRPFNCRLYLCNLAERLAALREMTVAQGTWHAYALLGWLPGTDLAHNPLLQAGSYDRTRLRDLEFGNEAALRGLFFYF